MMGSPDSEVPREALFEELHQVTLSRAFLMHETEVTQSQWQRLMGNNPASNVGDSRLPVERVSAYEAMAYANALSAADGLTPAYDLSTCTGTAGTQGFTCGGVTLTAASPYAAIGWRLPTESEWEYACRAGTTTPWYFGNDSNLLGQYEWSGAPWMFEPLPFEGNSNGTSHPVGEKLANPWGLKDLAGNVAEWTQDRFDRYAGSATDPFASMTGASRDTYMSVRGGSWAGTTWHTRSASRFAAPPDYRWPSLGFRLVRTSF